MGAFLCMYLTVRHCIADPADNAEGSCTYHPEKPVFHDTIKYYNCCPKQQAYDWDAFMKIPGCHTGKHD